MERSKYRYDKYRFVERIWNAKGEAMKLAEELKQSKPFRTAEAEAFLDIVRTADVLIRELDQFLRPHGLTSTQYNALRILRGAGGDGATCSHIAERLITNDPDVTRLLDRLERSEFVARARSKTDRRVVLTVLTRRGHDVLTRLDREVDALHRKQFGALSKRELSQLIELVDRVRTSREPAD